jgi:hypothetical protein
MMLETSKYGRIINTKYLKFKVGVKQQSINHSKFIRTILLLQTNVNYYKATPHRLYVVSVLLLGVVDYTCP